MTFDTFVVTPSGMTDLRTGLPWDAAHIYGFPWRGNTGPTGDLTPAGTMVITENDVVLENLDITGEVTFEGTGGVLRNCRVTSNNYWPCRFLGAGGLVEDSEVIGGDNSQTSLLIRSGTVRRSDFHGAGDGVRMEVSGVIEDSYIHDMADFEGAHNDGLELYPGGPGETSFTITHNSLLNRIGQTSCLMMSNWGVNPDVQTLVTDNLIAGGGYSVYGHTPGSDVIGGLQVVDNVFSAMFFLNSGSYGPVNVWPGSPNIWSNTWIDGPNAGQPVLVT